MTVSGTVCRLVSTMTFSYTGTIRLTNSASLTTGGKTLTDLYIDGASKTVTCQDTLNVTTLRVYRGTLDGNDHPVNIASFNSNTTTYARGITMGSGTWTASGGWVASDTNLTVTPETSLLKFTGSSRTLYTSTKTYHDVEFALTAGQTATLSHALTANGTITVQPGVLINLGVHKTHTAATWVLNGASGNHIQLFGSLTHDATVAKSGGGTVGATYCTITRCIGSPADTFYAANSTDGGSNTNWTFTTIPGSTPRLADRVLFVTVNVLDSATVSASSACSGLPASNVQSNLIRKVYRSKGIANEWVLFDCAAVTGINGIFIGKHSLTKNAVVQWQGNCSASWATPLLNVTLAVATDALGTVVPTIAHFFATTHSYRYWRLYVKDSGNTDTTLDVGRVFAGSYIQPTRNMQDGYSIEEVDPSTGALLASRQAYWNTRDSYRKFSYDVTDATKTQVDQLGGIYDSVGMHTPFVMSLDPKDRPHHNTMYVQFTSPVKRTQRFLTYHNIDPVEIEEKV